METGTAGVNPSPASDTVTKQGALPLAAPHLSTENRGRLGDHLTLWTSEINPILISISTQYTCMAPFVTISEQPYFPNLTLFLWQRAVFIHLQTYIAEAGRGQDPDLQRYLAS